MIFRVVVELTRQPEITLIVAVVYEESQYHRDQDRNSQASRFVVRSPPSAQGLGLRVVLSAVLDDGRRITADNCFGISGLDMSPDAVDAQINRMLGRDPHVRRPPALAWRPLIAALKSIGISRSESELIRRPLDVCYEPSAQRALMLGLGASRL